MANGYKRLSRKARHLIRSLKRTKHASVQRTMVNELQHEIHRHWGSRKKATQYATGNPGHWRPLTHRAKQLLTRLRKAKVWSVQKQIVRELVREMERGRRRAAQAAKRARGAARATRRGAQAAGRGAQAAGRTVWTPVLFGRAAARKARPHVARAGRATGAQARAAARATKSRWARARNARRQKRHPLGPPQRLPRQARPARQRPVRQARPIRRAPRVRARRAPRIRARARA